MQLTDPYPIRPFRFPLHGKVAVPGSKSITNRALLLAALTEQKICLSGALFSRDTHILMQALRQLGYAVEADPEACTITVAGCGVHIPQDRGAFHVGNAGTAARFLTAFLCLHPDGEYELDGDAEMRERPMAGLLEALRQMGAEFTFRGKKDHFPFCMKTSGFRGGQLKVDARASSQMLSALLIAGCAAQKGLQIEAPGVRPAFVELTMDLIRQFGGRVADDSSRAMYSVEPSAPLFCEGGRYAIEPDLTAASYFMALPLAVGGGLMIQGLPANPLQGDARFADVVRQLGLIIEGDESGWRISRAEDTPEMGSGCYDFETFSDTFLTLAAVAPLLPGRLRIEGIAHTRHQETDRVAGMCAELRKLGIGVIEEHDAIEIQPDMAALRAAAVKGVDIQTYLDHRFAMSFAILGSRDVRGDGSAWLRIEDPACCGKTFPRFFEVLETLRGDSERRPFLVIAVDGGAASGKSSTSRLVAEQLKLLHVDTGAHYRAVTHACLKAGIDPQNIAKLEQYLRGLELDTRVAGGSAHILIDGILPDPDDLRAASVNAGVSVFAAIPAVREKVKHYQRDQAVIARDSGFGGLIMEGRDIGTVIFPQADLKIFLSADSATRQERRSSEGQTDSIAQRDQLDSTRKTAPLLPAQDAWCIDNSSIGLNEVVQLIVQRVQADFYS